MRRVSRSSILLMAGLGLVVGGAGLVGLRGGAQDATSAKGSHVVRRGEYLVKIMGCNDCHTPWKMGPEGPEPDMDRFLSGHPEQIGPVPNPKTPDPFLWSAF